MSEVEVLWEGEVRSPSEHKTTVERLRVARDKDGNLRVQAKRRDRAFGRQWWDNWNVGSSSHGPDLEDAAITIARQLRDLQAAAGEYREAVTQGEKLIQRMEESEPGVLDDDYYASNLRISRADAALAALLPPPAEGAKGDG